MYLGDDPVHFWVSPYLRCRMTLKHILSSFGICQFSVMEDSRLREQDFGNFQDAAAIQEYRKERQEFGIFYYRFPNGESGADVYDRASSYVTMGLSHHIASSNPCFGILTMKTHTMLLL